MIFSAREPLDWGGPAPDFALLDQDGHRRRLADYQGHWLVLYFYPKDHTPGCTKEACAFRDQWSALAEAGAAVLGVSLDDAATHRRFVRQLGLPFPLLTDPGGEVARAYGALFALGPLRFAKRHTVLIDPRGKVARIYRRVRAAGHGREVLADLRRLRGDAR